MKHRHIPITAKKRPSVIERDLYRGVDDFNAAYRLALMRAGPANCVATWGTA